jgi:hypothetical protein
MDIMKTFMNFVSLSREKNKKQTNFYLLGIPNLTLASIYHTPNPVSLLVNDSK